MVLVQPEIPQNTGNIGRTCVGLQSTLHLVGPLGFEITDAKLKRAGLDYWPLLEWKQYSNWDDWWKGVPDKSRVFFLSKKSSKPIYDIAFQEDDWLVFGCETKGLSEDIIDTHSSQTFQIPMPGPIRSLNLATAVAVVLYEGLRQFKKT